MTSPHSEGWTSGCTQGCTDHRRGSGNYAGKPVTLKKSDTALTLRVLVDRSVIDAFAMEGKACSSTSICLLSLGNRESARKHWGREGVERAPPLFCRCGAVWRAALAFC